MVLEAIDYKKVFYYFEKISSIPRGSKNNENISNYLVEFAKEHSLTYIQDSYYNVTIFKEASKGYEEAPTVMLQGHMDMVCERENGCQHDFTREGLDLVVEGDFIYAKGTTLGGDDGIAIAYALAILEDDSMLHPALEVVITTDEEIGMQGAIGLDTARLKATYMLNIDSEEEGILLASCAGGMTSVCRLPMDTKKIQGHRVELHIAGLQGGHSGTEINKNRTNATLLMGRMLNFFKNQKLSFAIAHISGGLKDNAITREARVELVMEDLEALEAKRLEFLSMMKKELKTSEPNLTIVIQKEEFGEYEVLTEALKEKILFFLAYTPQGIQTMSADIEGLVESSLNLGIFTMPEQEIVFSYSVRSSVHSYKKYLGERLKALIEHLGGSYVEEGDYPAWEYKADSKLRELLCKVFEKQYGYSPKIEAIHAGIECGIIAGKMPEIDIVSFGPNIFDIHTPKERMSISSTIRVYDFIVHILEEICRTETMLF